MKSLKKVLTVAASSALALTLGAFALTGCGGGKDYTFEAEDAKTEGIGLASDMSQKPASVETDQVLWSEDGTGTDTVSGYGGFNAVGQKIIWTVVAESDCKVNITLYAASAAMVVTDYTVGPSGIAEIDLGNADAYALKVNDTEATLKGTLPATSFEGGWQGMGTPGIWWHIGTATCSAELKKGENTIVLEIVGQATDSGSGINVDKIVINSSSALTAKE